MNIGGAATTLSIGAGTGTTTVNNALTVTGTLTANGTLKANGIANIGDGGDAVTISGTTLSLSANGAGNDITLNLVDNNPDALDIQQGANNYINVNTTDGAEVISFGNVVTNPTYSFLGSGKATFGGNVAINGGSLTTSAASANLFNSNATTLNIGGVSYNISLVPVPGILP